MKKLKFLVSLTTNDNDYQIEQAAAAEAAARRLGVDLQIIYAENDSITQSQQILSVIQSRSDAHPDGIIFEPVGGTALPQVARAAVGAGISWVVLNRNVDYIAEIRRSHRVPIFGVSSNHEEIGRIQGHQFAALLPKGGTVLHIQGPSESLAAKQRTTGMYETKPAEVQVVQARLGLDVRTRNRRKNPAFRRQGEWFFLPEPDFVAPEALVLHNEPLRRGNGGKPHWAEECCRSGGETVYVCRRHPNGVSTN